MLLPPSTRSEIVNFLGGLTEIPTNPSWLIPYDRLAFAGRQ
jgi:hypothetical protein